MSSPLRKRIRSPCFSPHSSAGLSERETMMAENHNSNNKAELGSTQGAQNRRLQHWRMVTNLKLSTCLLIPTKPMNRWDDGDELCYIRKRDCQNISTGICPDCSGPSLPPHLSSHWWIFITTDVAQSCFTNSLSGFRCFRKPFNGLYTTVSLFQRKVKGSVYRSRWETHSPPPPSPYQPP